MKCRSMLERGVKLVYKTPKDIQERKDAKRRHILHIAARVFSNRGYHGTTVKDVVDEAGVSVGSFYFYFKNKEDLFETLYDEMTDMLLNAINGVLEKYGVNISEALSRTIAVALLTFRNYRDLARIMMIEAVGLSNCFELKRAESVRNVSNLIEEYLVSRKKQDCLDISDVHVAAIALCGTVYNSIINWLHKAGQSDLAGLAYPLAIYNLQALKIGFNTDDIRKYIETTLLDVE